MMSWDEIGFGVFSLFIGYGMGVYLERDRMEAKRSRERERESEVLKEERKKWIDHGRAIERQNSRSE